MNWIIKTSSVLTLFFLGINSVAAQDTPTFSDPFNIIVGYAPGGASDRAARFVAEQLQNELGTTVIVENKTGAGGRLAVQHTKNQPENRDTLMIGNPATIVVAPLVFDNLPYDPNTDLKTVAMVTDYNFGVAVAAESPIQTIQELIEWASENPAEFNVGVPASGSLPHFFGLMLADLADIDAEIIGYRGSAPALNDLMGGSIPVAIDTLDVLTNLHSGERIRILATSGDEIEAKLPEVPTFKSAGLELQASGWNGMFAPAVMSDEKVEYLGELIKDIMSRPEVQQRFLDSDLPPVAANNTEAQAMIDDFADQWVPIIKTSGYKVEQ